MAEKYLKIFVDCLDKYQKLNDAEFGRLIRAALTYKATGVEVELMGREELLWDGMKLDIDRDNKAYSDVCKTRSEAGKAGAAKRWQNMAKMANANFANGKNSKRWQKCQEEDKEEDKDKDISSSPLPPSSSQMPLGNDDDDLISVVRLWEKASGRVSSLLQKEELLALLEEYTAEQVCNAIRSASRHNAVNTAYVEAVLRGKPKPQANGGLSAEMQEYIRRRMEGEE